MEPAQTPRRRRSDVYHQAAEPEAIPAQAVQAAPPQPVSPAAQPVFSNPWEAQPVPVQPQEASAPSQPAMSRRERPPRTPAPQEQPMERPPKAVRREEKAPLPRWLTWSIAGGVLLLVLLLTAGWLMQGYLQRQEEARVQAHETLLANHPLSYRELIERYAAENNLQPAYVAAIILNESSYRTDAESGVGARGLMQVMEDTAEWIAHKLGVDDYSFDMLWDAETNIRFGCWYLGWLSELFGGDPVAVTAAYHAGQGQVSTWLADSTISPDGRTLQVERMPEGNTKIYAGRVTQAYAIYDALYYHALNSNPDSDTADGDYAAGTGN